jgi:hypothetical protein
MAMAIGWTVARGGRVAEDLPALGGGTAGLDAGRSKCDLVAALVVLHALTRLLCRFLR